MTDGSSGDEIQHASHSERRADFRAATMLRGAGHMSFDRATENALMAMATEMNISRLDLIRMALSDWLRDRNNACTDPK